MPQRVPGYLVPVPMRDALLENAATGVYPGLHPDRTHVGLLHRTNHLSASSFIFRNRFLSLPHPLGEIPFGAAVIATHTSAGIEPAGSATADIAADGAFPGDRIGIP